MASESNNANSGDIGFCGLLTVVFITLKLLHIISWAWLWVLAPLWLPLAIVLGVLLAVGLGWVIFN